MKNIFIIALFASQTFSRVTFDSKGAPSCQADPDIACCGTKFDPQSSPVRTVRAGEFIEVAINQQGQRGGRVEFAFVPVNEAHSWTNHKQQIFMFTCFQSKIKVPVPPHLQGTHTLRYRRSFAAANGKFEVGVPDQTSCMNYEIINENPSEPTCPIFVGNAIDGQPACEWLVPDSQEIVHGDEESILVMTCETRARDGQTCVGTRQVGVFKEVPACGEKYLRDDQTGGIVGWEGFQNSTTIDSSVEQEDSSDGTDHNLAGPGVDLESNGQVGDEINQSQQVELTDTETTAAPFPKDLGKPLEGFANVRNLDTDMKEVFDVLQKKISNNNWVGFKNI